MKKGKEELQTVVTAEGKGKKKIGFLLAGIAIVLVLGIALIVTARKGRSEGKVAEQLNLGNKYLDELDFERAIVAYEAVLAIDPKNAEAYVGLIDTYGAQENAAQIAETYLKAAGELTGVMDASELRKVQAEAAAQLENLIHAALAAGDYAKAADYAAQLAKVDETRAETVNAQMTDAQGGTYITFGHYEQDNHAENGAEPIEWLVLDRRDGKMLIISRYALDCRQYNEEYTDVTWEACTLRGWLNDTFYRTAFDAEEQERIVAVTNENPGSREFYNSDYAVDLYCEQGRWRDENGNPIREEVLRTYGTAAGNATVDRIFLLSWEEALEYFASDEARRCSPTAYAIAQGGHTGTGNYAGSCWWLLRSPGISPDTVLDIYTNGAIASADVDYNEDTMRPALWITE